MNDKISESYIADYDFTTNAYEKNDYETQDIRKHKPGVFDKSFDDSAWANAVVATPLDTKYLCTDCPADQLLEELSIEKLGENDGTVLFNTGKNCSAILFLQILVPRGEEVMIEFYEVLRNDGNERNRYI